MASQEPMTHATSASGVTTEQDKTTGVGSKRKRGNSWEALVNMYRTWRLAKEAVHDADICQRLRDEAERARDNAQRALEKAQKTLERQIQVRRVVGYHRVLCWRKYSKCDSS